MFGFLGFILLFIFLIVVVALGLISYFLRMLFGFGKRTPKPYSNSKSTGSEYTANQQTTSSTSSSANKKKIFGEDEGEYVEYEEIN